MKKQIFSISLGILIITLLGFFTTLTYQYLFAPRTDASRTSEIGSPEVLILQVNQGMTFKSLAKDLERKSFIKNSLWFVMASKIMGKSGHLKVGEYRITSAMSPLEIIQVLSSGKSIDYAFTVSEGLNIFEIAQLFESQGFGSRAEFLAEAKNPALIQELLGENLPTFEGYLYPETYRITKKTKAKDLIQTMVKRFLKIYQSLAPHGSFSRHQLVTFASLVEKETGAPEERPLIASVFYNRLKKNMRLQTDPTLLYGKALDQGAYILNLTKKDLMTQHPYNSYLNHGLPPGPIANPGIESFKAVLQPANSSYLFFVSKNNGTHIFSETYEAHSKSVQQFQKNAKAREGKSWRDYSRDK